MHDNSQAKKEQFKEVKMHFNMKLTLIRSKQKQHSQTLQHKFEQLLNNLLISVSLHNEISLVRLQSFKRVGKHFLIIYQVLELNL